jgi:hypothetical protein
VGLPVVPARRVDARQLLARHGEHAEGVAVAQVLLGGEGKLRQVGQLLQVVGVHARLVELGLVHRRVGVGVGQRPLEPLQLQRAQLVDAGLLDRLQRKGLVGHEEAPAGSGITVPLICVLLPRNSATAWPFWLLTRMS